jgi:predicted PurR-regulated permease PerM
MPQERLNELKTIKNLLVVIVVPLVAYLLKELSFIFVPLTSAVFIALLFMPMMRWMFKRKVPGIISLIIVIAIMAAGVKVGVELVKISIKEIKGTDITYWQGVGEKLNDIVLPIEDFFGINTEGGDNSLTNLIQSEEFTQSIYKNFGSTINFLRVTISMILVTVFFLLLLLTGSMDVQKVMEDTIFKKRTPAIKTYIKIEKSIVQFIKVKFVLSALTGIGFGLACVIFGIRFPFFWGLIAFVINFVQLIGTIVATSALSLFAYAEMEPSGTLLFFILVIVGIQVLFGGVLEPIFMGKSFSINTVSVLVMLMLWGYIWGIPGLILSVPITVLVKTIMEQLPKTKVIANIMS